MSDTPTTPEPAEPEAPEPEPDEQTADRLADAGLDPDAD